VEAAMREPILFVVDEDPEARAAVATALERRFGADYRILTEASPGAALERLGTACQQGEPVALVLAGVSTAEMTGLDWLARVHDLCPRAARCALISDGEGPTYPVVRRALVLGQLDSYMLKPIGDPEDRLYPIVSEMLGSWARATRPRVPVLRIVERVGQPGPCRLVLLGEVGRQPIPGHQVEGEATHSVRWAEVGTNAA